MLVTLSALLLAAAQPPADPPGFKRPVFRSDCPADARAAFDRSTARRLELFKEQREQVGTLERRLAAVKARKEDPSHNEGLLAAARKRLADLGGDTGFVDVLPERPGEGAVGVLAQAVVVTVSTADKAIVRGDAYRAGYTGRLGVPLTVLLAGPTADLAPGVKLGDLTVRLTGEVRTPAGATMWAAERFDPATALAPPGDPNNPEEAPRPRRLAGPVVPTPRTTPRPAPPSSPSTPPTARPKPKPPEFRPVTAAVGGVSVTVHGVRPDQELAKKWKTGKGYAVVVLDVEVATDRRSTAKYGPKLFRVKDDKGREADADLKGFAGSMTASGLRERDRVRGLLAFEVADPAAPLTLTFAGGPKPVPVRVAR